MDELATRASLNDEPAIGLEEIEARVRTVRADLQEAEQRLAELRARAEEATFRGDDGANDDEEADLRIAAAQVKVERLRGALRDYEALIPPAKAAKAQTAAKDRGLGIVRAFTSLAAQVDKDIRRIEDASAALTEAVARLNGRYTDMTGFALEAIVLAERFGVTFPDLRLPAAPARIERVRDALARAGAAPLLTGHPVPHRLHTAPYRGAGWSVRNILDRVKGTPTGALLAEAGRGTLADAEEWEARRGVAMVADGDRLDAAERAEVSAVDDWLRDLLSHGPVLLPQVVQAAKDKGVPLRGIGHLRTLADASQKLGVRSLHPLVKIPSGESGRSYTVGPDTFTTYWALPGTWPEDQFEPV